MHACRSRQADDKESRSDKQGGQEKGLTNSFAEPATCSGIRPGWSLLCPALCQGMVISRRLNGNMLVRL